MSEGFTVEVFGPWARTEVLEVPASGLRGPNARTGVPWDLVAERDRAGVLVVGDRPGAYAFLIGRLERDFTQAREATRTAAERAAGIPLLWVDDGRHRTNVAGVRERTRLLIKHAAFVVADLTLGAEGRDRENPSRAHEIGMAIAYDRPLMVSSQEPRRHPYFSIADMQLWFWETEADLHQHVCDWIFASRESVARRVFNYELPEPNVGPPTFAYDPARRFVGPNLEVARALRVLPR